jgi:hypothetical protein
MAVREMAPMGEVETHDGIARLQERHISGHVCLRAGVRLHVGMLRAEKLHGPVTRQGFYHISKLAAAIVAFARISLRILIGKDRSLRFQDRHADKVL